jgi:hypothetical protein
MSRLRSYPSTSAAIYEAARRAEQCRMSCIQSTQVSLHVRLRHIYWTSHESLGESRGQVLIRE